MKRDFKEYEYLKYDPVDVRRDIFRLICLIGGSGFVNQFSLAMHRNRPKRRRYPKGYYLTPDSYTFTELCTLIVRIAAMTRNAVDTVWKPKKHWPKKPPVVGSCWVLHSEKGDDEFGEKKPLDYVNACHKILHCRLHSPEFSHDRSRLLPCVRLNGISMSGDTQWIAELNIHDFCLAAWWYVADQENYDDLR